MIKVANVSKRFAGRTVVDAVSFEVAKGEVVGFLGPNGAGKTTTLRIITGYLPPSSGRAEVAGFDVFQDSLRARQSLGYMPENVPLYHDMRVKEYLNFRGALKGLRGPQLRKSVGEAMDVCSIEDVRRRIIGTLSKGYRQRVGLADALVNRPPLLILDEPTNGLDPNQIRQVRSLIKSLGTEHTILISTHLLAEVEATCDRVIIISKGQVRAQGTSSDLAGNLRMAGQVRVELKGDPAAIERGLAELKSVKKVTRERSAGNWHSFTLRVEAGADVREAIDHLARKEAWPLRELSQRGASLEEVFVEITQRQELDS